MVGSWWAGLLVKIFSFVLKVSVCLCMCVCVDQGGGGVVSFDVEQLMNNKCCFYQCMYN